MQLWHYQENSKITSSDWLQVIIVWALDMGCDGPPAACGEFDAWVKANGRKPADKLWEFYSVGPHSMPDPTD